MDKFVTRRVYVDTNQHRDSIIDTEKAELDTERRVDRDRERDIRHKADHAAAMRRFQANRAVKPAAEAVEPSAEIVEPAAEGELNVRFLPELPVNTTKKTWRKRPKYWEDITDYYLDVKKDIKQVVDLFNDEFEGYNTRQAQLRVEEWVRNRKAGKKVTYQVRVPVIGSELDHQLLLAVRERVKLGLSVDSYILRVMLLALLEVHQKLDMLKSTGGENTFGECWASRFFERHKIQRPAAINTKMRIDQENFDELKEKYIVIFSNVPNGDNIPPSLTDGDESLN